MRIPDKKPDMTDEWLVSSVALYSIRGEAERFASQSDGAAAEFAKSIYETADRAIQHANRAEPNG